MFITFCHNDAWVDVVATEAKADNTYHSLATILWSNKGAARVSCADAFSCGGSTDHILRDVPAPRSEAAPSVAAIALRCHGQVDLLQGWRLVAFSFEFSPSGCSGRYSCISGCSV